MLEYAIRPYTSPNAQGRLLIPKTPTTNAEHPMLTWGAQSTLPAPTPGKIQVICCNEKSTQVDKQGEIIRITGNDDPGDGSGPSYMDVFRANQLLFHNKTDGGDGSGSNSCNNDPLFSFSSDVAAGVQAVLDEFNNAIASAAGGLCQQTMMLNNNTAQG